MQRSEIRNQVRRLRHILGAVAGHDDRAPPPTSLVAIRNVWSAPPPFWLHPDKRLYPAIFRWGDIVSSSVRSICIGTRCPSGVVPPALSRQRVAEWSERQYQDIAIAPACTPGNGLTDCTSIQFQLASQTAAQLNAGARESWAGSSTGRILALAL